MDLTAHIPNYIATWLNHAGNVLPCRALEALALQDCHISKPELRRTLGCASRYQLEGFARIRILAAPRQRPSGQRLPSSGLI